MEASVILKMNACRVTQHRLDVLNYYMQSKIASHKNNGSS